MVPALTIVRTRECCANSVPALRYREMRVPGGIMRATTLFALGPLALVASACASMNFRQVSFVSDAAENDATPPPARTVHVVRNREMKDTALEMRIRYKLEEFLLDKGYTIASPDTAEIYVLATFGTGERMVAGIAPVYRGPQVREERNSQGQVTRRTYVPEGMDYLRVPLVKNSVWLQVLSSDAKYYRTTGKVRNLWRGEAAMIGRPEILDQYAGYL